MPDWRGPRRSTRLCCGAAARGCRSSPATRHNRCSHNGCVVIALRPRSRYCGSRTPSLPGVLSGAPASLRHVPLRMPRAVVGGYAQWTPSSGSSHVLLAAASSCGSVSSEARLIAPPPGSGGSHAPSYGPGSPRRARRRHTCRPRRFGRGPGLVQHRFGAPPRAALRAAPAVPAPAPAVQLLVGVLVAVADQHALVRARRRAGAADMGIRGHLPSC